MPILKYTTKVEAAKTAMEIQKCLADHGANAILNEYDDEGYIIALSFTMKINDRDISFRLPSDWRPVLEVLKQDPKVPERCCTQEQALRVAWRIIKTWVEAQMAFIETRMVRMEQVFLPYVVMPDGGTLSDKILKDPRFLLKN